jgi:hypothetical protein
MATAKSKISWRAPATNTDGSPFTVDQYAGFTLYFLNPDNSDKSTVAIPAQWSVDGAYQYPLADLDLLPGDYRIAMTVTNKAGVESDKSVAADFTMAATPAPPTNLSVGDPL